MIERAGFALQQGEVVDRVKRDLLLVPDAAMGRHHLAPASNLDPIHESFGHDRVMGAADRHGVVIAVKAHERK